MINNIFRHFNIFKVQTERKSYTESKYIHNFDVHIDDRGIKTRKTVWRKSLII